MKNIMIFSSRRQWLILALLVSLQSLFSQAPADMEYAPNGTFLNGVDTWFIVSIPGVTFDGDEYAAAYSTSTFSQVGPAELINPSFQFNAITVNGEADCGVFPNNFFPNCPAEKATNVIPCNAGDCGNFFFIIYDPDGNTGSGAYYVVNSIDNLDAYDFDNSSGGFHSVLNTFGGMPPTPPTISAVNEPFASIADILAALPVTYLSFTAATRSGDVHLDWATATELDNDHFLVERSGDGRTFTPIGKVKGAGTTELVQKYSYVDTEPFPGPNYYRLKQIDFDGAFEYSSIISVNFNRKGETAVRVQPNPATDRVSIGLDGSWREEATDVHLYDLAGKRVGGLLSQSPGMINLPIAELVPGVYLLQVTDGRNVMTERLVIR